MATGQSLSLAQRIGSRLNQRRIDLGLSLEDLAGRLGISQVLINECEFGTRLLEPSLLFQVADILKVPVWYFFEECDADHDLSTRYAYADNIVKVSRRRYDSAKKCRYDLELYELFEVFYSIDDQRIRMRVMELMRSLRRINNNEGSSEKVVTLDLYRNSRHGKDGFEH